MLCQENVKRSACGASERGVGVGNQPGHSFPSRLATVCGAKSVPKPTPPARCHPGFPHRCATGLAMLGGISAVSAVSAVIVSHAGRDAPPTRSLHQGHEATRSPTRASTKGTKGHQPPQELPRRIRSDSGRIQLWRPRVWRTSRSQSARRALRRRASAGRAFERSFFSAGSVARSKTHSVSFCPSVSESEVPLAVDGRSVAGPVEKRRDGGLLDGEAELVAFGQADGVVVAADVRRPYRTLQSADPLEVSPGHEGGAGGGAFGGRGVVLGETDALGGEAVGDGGSQVRGAVAGQVAVALVVGEDEEDVRALAARWPGGAAGGQGGERRALGEELSAGRSHGVLLQA